MSSLIDDLLALTRLSRRPMKVERVDVTLLAEEVAAELGAGHVAVQRGLVARADPHLLRVVLQNLIGNAVKFSGRRGEPRVEVLAAAGGALAVRDNGVGFDMQYAGKMFEPFQRLHPSSQFEGTGIGLAIVKRLIRRHGGTVRAESAPDQGASFYFTLGEQR
jgi:signal transduction histidine kinase